MIIKRVKLENYRSHSNKVIEFSKGVNLILGKNGKGKTSILEAISSVMFNINDRTGRERGKNYIKYGQQNAKVEIEFTANDDKDYILITTFSQKKPRKQKIIDKETEIVYSNDDVKLMLELLCGIKVGFEKIYENIVIAKQNEFINVFKESPSEREKIFNKIFNTDIYKDMCEFFKLSRDIYKKERDDISTKINFSKENMENKDEVLTSLKNEEEKRDDLENKKNKLIVKVDNLIKKIENYNKADIELKNLTENYLNELNKLKKDRITLKENISEAKKAKKAKDVVKKNEQSYFEYLESQEKLKEKREQLDNLLEEERLNIQYKHNIDKLELANKNLKTDISNLEENISKNFEKKENLTKEISELEIKEHDLSLKLKEYENLLVTLENFEKNKDEKLKQKLKKETEIDILEKNLSSKKNLFENIDIDNIEKKLINFQELEKEFESLKEQKVAFEIEIDTLKNASNELSSKICPYLKENCENLKDKEAEDYFSSKISLKIKDLESLKKTIEEKVLILTEKSIFEEKKKQYFELGKTIKDLELSLKNEELNLKEINFDIKALDNDIQKLIENQKIKDSLSLKEKKKELEFELRSLNLEEKRKNLKTIIDNLEVDNKKVLKNQDTIKENLGKIEEYSKNIVENTDKKISLSKEDINSLELTIEKLKEFYDEYLKNNALAKTLGTSLLKVEKNIKDLYDLRAHKIQLKEEVNILENEIKKINIVELKETYTIKKENLDETNKNLGSSEEKVEVYKKSLQNILEQEKKQQELLVSLKKFENKYNKTLQVIDNVSQMGRSISKYMLANISNIASLNFNKITGRTEKIEWSNEDDDKYAVYLVGKERKIAFEQLSGGEQVSVAIAIRGTMTEYFTNSRFMILDEPTNNLDTERKKLLAEYMGEILKNLDQSIIVTHDDTFREMAEKIIEL